MSVTAFQRMRREKASKEAKRLADMTIEELKQYAKSNNIDIGKATSQSGILEKILSRK